MSLRKVKASAATDYVPIHGGIPISNHFIPTKLLISDSLEVLSIFAPLLRALLMLCVLLVLGNVWRPDLDYLYQWPLLGPDNLDLDVSDV